MPAAIPDQASDIAFTPAGGLVATDVQGALAELGTGKSGVVHTHTIVDVAGLSAALAGKASTSHTHATADVAGLDAALALRAAAADVAAHSGNTNNPTTSQRIRSDSATSPASIRPAPATSLAARSPTRGCHPPSR